MKIKKNIAREAGLKDIVKDKNADCHIICTSYKFKIMLEKSRFIENNLSLRLKSF